MKNSKKTLKSLEWDKKEVYEADAKRYMSKLSNNIKKLSKKIKNQ